ncbi:hypothetical protein Tsubulata_019859 [Turnera subulata]|uniref:Uncharacterized protein n=1 Tax=Turnera subulata TaxID=218843 RepID=A0A9Q0GG70_9ROSI|nr:hypothetical protein Tsubulata_019859 [Turnera subulata]
MGGGGEFGNMGGWPPIGAPLLNGQQREDQHWRHFDNSVNAVSFGFVATAILISMFLVMAIFERFLRPASGGAHGDLESQMGFNPKLGHPSPKMTVYANGVSVLMPGDNIPTFIAHPAPVVPCQPDIITCPHRQNIEASSNPMTASGTNSSSSATQGS